MTDAPLRYRWRFTWDDRTENDFEALDEDVVIGRIHLTYVSPRRRYLWAWALQCFHGLKAGQIGGVMDGTVHEAARFFEDHYDAVAPLSTGLHVRPAAREVAFYERKGLPVPEPTLWRVERGQ